MGTLVRRFIRASLSWLGAGVSHRFLAAPRDHERWGRTVGRSGAAGEIAVTEEDS